MNQRDRASLLAMRAQIDTLLGELRPKWIKSREDARVDGKPQCKPATIAGYKWHNPGKRSGTPSAIRSNGTCSAA